MVFEFVRKVNYSLESCKCTCVNDSFHANSIILVEFAGSEKIRLRRVELFYFLESGDLIRVYNLK